MSRKYVAMTVAELQAACCKPGQVVFFEARQSAVNRMPVAPLDARRPRYKGPVTFGMVIGVRGRRARIESGHGECGTIAVEDALYLEDPL